MRGLKLDQTPMETRKQRSLNGTNENTGKQNTGNVIKIAPLYRVLMNQRSYIKTFSLGIFLPTKLTVQTLES